MAAESTNHEISYTYDMAGIRDSKTVGDITYEYMTLSGKVMRQTWEDEDGEEHVINFAYDNTGSPYAFTYDDTLYYYVLNQQGDVIRIVNANGVIKAQYQYNAWGKVLSATGDMAAVNPIRYRGYYYDAETGFYYLQSRYYDPSIGRFINADSIVSTGQGFLGYNIFAYCLNSPVQLKDASGLVPTESVDIDGDGEVDYYRYDYTYSYLLWIDDQFVEQTVSGSVYYFSDIGGPENLDDEDYPEGFNSRYDLMVGYYLDSDDEGDNPVMYAYQAHHTAQEAMLPIIKVMQQCDSDFETPWDRTTYSLYVEWDAHRHMAIHPRAQNVDFDNREEGKNHFYFYGKAIKAVFTKN